MPYRIPPGARGALAPHSEGPDTTYVDEGEPAAGSCALCQYVLAPRWRYCPLCGTHRSVRSLEVPLPAPMPQPAVTVPPPPWTIFITAGSSTGGNVNVPRQWTS